MAAIQAKPSDGLFTEKNLPRALKLLDDVARMEVDIAAFPEGYPSTGEKELCKKAREINSYVIATMLQKTQASKYGSTCILISPEGEVIGRQGKTTLLWVFEEGLFESVDSLPLHDTTHGKLGILRCSEIIYPEPMSILTMMGADIVFVVSNWNANVISLWHRIILVRSWENWMPVVGVNTAEWVKPQLVYAGFELEPRYGGHSIIVIPEDVMSIDEFIVKPYSGEKMFTEERLIRAKAGKDEEILVVDIDMKRYSEFRWKVFFRNRRLKFNALGMVFR
ncbi:MAG: carbon-nitrogen hydrolase family protein [Nitrososphaerota archaeon]